MQIIMQPLPVVECNSKLSNAQRMHEVRLNEICHMPNKFIRDTWSAYE